MIKSIQKATNLLTILADNHNKPMSLALLAQKSQINKSTCSHIMSTLEADGYVVKISSSKGYIIGPSVYCLSRFGRYKDDLISLCRPFMQYLYNSTGYSTVLAIIEGNKKFIIDFIDDGRIFESSSQIHVDDIYRTATGRAILSNLSKEQLYSIYQNYGLPISDEWPNFSNFNEFCNFMINQKSNKYFKCRQLRNDSKKLNLGYAIPIYKKLTCIASIGVAICIPAEDEKTFLKEEEKIIHLLKQCCNGINNRLYLGIE